MLQRIEMILDEMYSSDKSIPNVATYTPHKVIEHHEGYTEIKHKHSIQSHHDGQLHQKIHFANNAICRKFLNKMAKVLHNVE